MQRMSGILVALGALSLARLSAMAQQEACTASMIARDRCAFKYDGECDANTLYCPGDNTDCFDCDPCVQYSGDCAACTAQTTLCGYCTTAGGTGICLSMGYVDFISDLCSAGGGTEWLLGRDECTAASTTIDEPSTDATTTASCRPDVCEYEFDFECDAGLYCLSNTDCFDCDPCQEYASSCSACTNAGCRYGVAQQSSLFGLLTTSVPVCSSEDNAAAALAMSSFPVDYPTKCPDEDDVTAVSPSTCDYSADTCRYGFDGECDAGTIFCPASNSDCFDCDPCRRYRFEGCEACTSAAAGCVWCAADALCLSSSNLDVTDFPERLECRSVSDFQSTCGVNSGRTGATTASVFDDPLFESQKWVFDLVNVQEAWELGYTGEGIGIRVNDDGVDHTHEEFQGRFEVSGSCSVYRPYKLDSKHGHGTVVASLAAGSGGNNQCGVGIAHKARISGCRVINSDDPSEVASEFLDSTALFANMDGMHISQNSYGISTCEIASRRRKLQVVECPFDDSSVCTTCSSVDWGDPSPSTRCERAITSYCRRQGAIGSTPEACFDFLDLFTECSYNSMQPDELIAFRTGATSGRDGKGIIYVFASGNSHDAGADVNFEGVLTSRYTISVGAVGRDGLHASYSTGGAALHVVAPGGDLDHYTNTLAAKAGGGCYDRGPGASFADCGNRHVSYLQPLGTSFSAPLVSGVIALILEANADLTWRDVQGILATTSRVVDEGEKSWTTNSAGVQHSYLYGFGIVDAGAAVKAAASWSNYPPERQVIAESEEENVPIPEYPNDGITSTVFVDEGSFVVESVAIYVDLLHSSRGDLELVLVSPSGTESILHPSKRPENTQEERWKLLSVRHWGEEAKGTWSLRVVDHREGDISTCVDKIWQIRLAGYIDINCGSLERSVSCEDGGQGRSFRRIFQGIASSLGSTNLADEDGLTPDDACCACGGGTPAEDIENTLKSWRLVLYGHEAGPAGQSGTSSTTTILEPGIATSATTPESRNIGPSPLSKPSDGATAGLNSSGRMLRSCFPALVTISLLISQLLLTA